MQHKLNVSRETILKYELYEKELLKWNGAINLISETTESNIIGRHILDSLQLTKYIDKSQTIVDFGSGAGFPGMVLAIEGYKVSLVESDRRKCEFLKHVARLYNLSDSEKCCIYNSRIESMHSLRADYAISRACAQLPQLLEYSDLHLKSGGKSLFLKGKAVHDEIKLACLEHTYYQIYNSMYDDGYIIEIQHK